MKRSFILGVSLGLLAGPLFAETTTEQATALEQETATTPAEAAPVAVEEQSGFSRGSVVRSAFTTAVQDREPTDDVKTLSNDSNQVFYYTELRDMSGQTAMHRWEYNGKVMAEVPFNVKGPRWRVWSQKSLVPGWTGDWKVSVLNGAGEVIAEDMLTYTEQSAQPAASEQEISEPVATPAQ